MSTEQERAAFEAWAQNSFELHRHSAGEYSSKLTQTAWAAWQARAALQSQSMPPEISRDLLGKIVDEVFDGAIEDASVIEDIYRVVARECALQSQDRDGARLDWLQQHDERFYNLLRITSIVNKGFSPANNSGKQWFSSIREAIDHARRIEGEIP